MTMIVTNLSGPAETTRVGTTSGLRPAPPETALLPVCRRKSDIQPSCSDQCPFSNFPGNIADLQSARRYTPQTLDDLVAIVKQAEAEDIPMRVRAVGSAWAFTTINFTPDYLVCTDALNKKLSETMTGVELPRFAGQVLKPYAAFFLSKQSSNALGVS